MNVFPERSREKTLGRFERDLPGTYRHLCQAADEGVTIKSIPHVLQLGSGDVRVVGASVVAEHADLGTVVIANDDPIPELLGQGLLEGLPNGLPPAGGDPDSDLAAKEAGEL